MSAYTLHKSVKTQATLPLVLPFYHQSNRSINKTINSESVSNSRYKKASVSLDQIDLKKKKQPSIQQKSSSLQNNRYQRKVISKKKNHQNPIYASINQEKLYRLGRQAKDRKAIVLQSKTENVRNQNADHSRQKRQQIKSIYFPKSKAYINAKEKTKIIARKRQSDIQIMQMNTYQRELQSRPKINTKPQSSQKYTISISQDQLQAIAQESKNKAAFSSNSQLREYEFQVKNQVYQTLTHLKPTTFANPQTEDKYQMPVSLIKKQKVNQEKQRIKQETYIPIVNNNSKCFSENSAVFSNIHSLNDQKQERLITASYQPHLELMKLVDKSTLVLKKYSNGTYFGQINQEGLKNGLGVIFFKNGKLYQGEFRQDIKHGEGYQVYPDGSVFLGNFQNGFKNGKGKFVWPNGESYEGQWKDGKKHGSGIWKTKDNKQSYMGQWRQGSIQGFGVLIEQNGTRYEGEFQSATKHGKGTLRLPSGDTYIGQFRKNTPNGYGEYYWIGGDHFKGDFSNGLRHGKGCQKTKDGATYSGQFRNDKKCGYGQQKYQDGVLYIGNFQNNFRHGYGQLYCDGKTVYKGYWINNKSVQVSDTPIIVQDQREQILAQKSIDRLKKLQKAQKSSKNSLNISKIEKMQKQKSRNQLKRNKSSQKQFLVGKVQYHHPLCNAKSVQDLEKNEGYRRACNCKKKH